MWFFKRSSKKKAVPAPEPAPETILFTELERVLSGEREAAKFSLNGLETYAAVIKTYDGDTITISFKFLDRWFWVSCRMYGYNSAEIRTRDAEEKARGLAAKEYIAGLVLKKIIWVKFYDFDKYGRPLIDVQLLDDDRKPASKLVRDIMIKAGHGAPYYGVGPKKY